jgi:hypothetical protein
MPSTVQQVLRIAVTVYEAERQQKKIWLSFQTQENTGELVVTLVNPGRPLDGQSSGSMLGEAKGHMQQNCSVSKMQINANRKGNERKVCCSKCGKSGHFSRDFSNNSSTWKSEGKNQFPQSQATGKPSKTYAAVTRRNTYHQKNL